jgi:PPOX class probable FMN-dependent enzyme
LYAGAVTTIRTVEELAAIYGEPVPTSIIKELDRISDDHRQFIEAAPFVIIATSGPEGLDCSPRGDPAGFVRVVDDKTLLIPDRRGNNRLDSLRNIVRDPRIALLFLIPGIGETLRANGRAELSNETKLCRSFAIGSKVPACVIVVTVESVYTQCPKALIRSKLWDPDTQIPRSALPTMGQILQNITCGEIGGEAWDEAYVERVKETIY